MSLIDPTMRLSLERCISRILEAHKLTRKRSDPIVQTVRAAQEIGLQAEMKRPLDGILKVDAENLLPRPVNKPLDEKDFGPVKRIRNCKYSLNKRKKLN